MKKILLSFILLILSESYYAQLSVTPNQTATNLANFLLGGGVTVTNAVLTCPTGANGIFTNGATTNLGINSGVVLSTGLVSSIPAGNGTQASTNNGAAGFNAMAPITGTSSNYDGCMLEFDIVPHCSPLNIKYKFASEEYPEYVNSGVNDAFGFFIDGPNPLGGNYTNFNLATVPGSGTPITIDNVNSSSNSAYYQTNSGSTIVYDGMTTVLTGSANVTPCAQYHLTLAITDGGDAIYDSGVFLQQSGISCNTPTVAASNPAAICAGQSATLSASGTTTYSWSTGSTSSSIVVSPTVTTTYTVGGSNIGTCVQSSKTVTVTVNPAPTAVAGPAQILTCAQTTTILAGSGGGTYAWSGPGIVSGGTSATPTVNAAGTYSLIVTSASAPFCPSLVSTVVVTANTTPPTPGASATGTLGCTVSTATLTGTGGGTYSWSGTGIVSGGTTANPVVNGTGPYVVTVTAANGCTATANTSVTQNITPPTPSASNSNSLNCTNTTSTLTATGGGAYSWSGTGIVSGGTTANPVVNGTGPYVVTVTAANGCTATANTSVAQNITPPTPSASNSNSLNCTNTTSTLTATGGGTYSWSGTGIVSGGTTANPVVNGTGPYVVTVTAANGCTATANTSIAQNITPPTPTASNSNSLNCTTTTATLTATGGGTYSWSGTGIVSGGTTANPVVNGTGPYVVTVTAANGCTATANTSVAQNTTAPSPTASNSGSLTCTTTSVTLTGTSGGTYNWSGPGIISGATTANPVVNLIGSYIVTVTAANGCTATANTTVSQNTTVPTVNAGTTQTLVCGVSTVTLTGSGSAGSSANWLGGVCGSATNYITTACAPGTYTLVATDNASGCTNTSTVSVSSSTNVPQATVNAITNSITCTNSVVAIGVTYSGTDPVTYAWTGPGITGSTTNSVTTANLSGTYNVTITNTSSNCQSVYSAVVPINTAPVPTNVAPSASITCLTNTVSLTATPTGTNYTYSWSGPGTILNGTTENPTVDANGNYVVTMTDNVNGCVGSFTVNVPSNTISPTFTLGSASSVTTTCAAPNATLSATSSTDPNTIYTWTTPSATTVTGTPISVSAPGIYTVVVTNTVNGCSTSSASSQSTVQVVADSGIPVVTLASNSLSITCTNPTPSVAVTTTANPVSYNWTPTSGIVAGTETTANPVFNAAGSYSVVVTNTISTCATGINANVVTVVLDNTAPTISLSSAVNDGTITCINTQVTITPTVTSSTANLTYTWLPSGVTSSTINDATFTSAGVYTLAITNTLTGCVSSATNSANIFTVYQNTISPTASITAISTNSAIGCSGNSSTVTLNGASSSSNFTNIWLPGSVTTSTLDVTTAGIYTLVVVDAVSGCSVTSDYTVSGSSTPPQNVDAGTNAAIPCGTPTVALNGTTTSTDVVTYDWSGPNAGSIVSGANTQNPIVMDQGIYTLTVTNISSGCSATATINVTQANVTAAFTANPTNGLTPLDVNFTDASTGAINYNWDFGDGSSNSAAVNPNHTYTTGSYTVTLTVSSGPCVSTATTVIIVEDGLTLEIPNVFTPNGDGSNEIFSIKSTGVKEISLQIFNRWGQKLYEFTGPKAAWDGLTPSGKEVPEGTYFYFVKAIGFDDLEIEKNGTVSLFR